MTNPFPAAGLALLLLGSAAAARAQPAPEMDVGHRHGNIEAAQSLTRQAFERLSEAQRDNHDDAGGHLQRAKQLLDQASAEMKAAAVFMNRHR